MEFNCQICSQLFAVQGEHVPVSCLLCNEYKWCQKCFTQNGKCPGCKKNAKFTINKMLVDLLPQLCCSCHTILMKPDSSYTCCNQKYCTSCYVMHVMNEMSTSFQTMMSFVYEIHRCCITVNKLISLEAKILKEYSDWYKNMQCKYKESNIIFTEMNKYKKESQNIQNQWLQNCYTPLNENINKLAKLFKEVNKSAFLQSIKATTRFNYKQNADINKKALKCNGTVVKGRRYMAVTEDNSRLLMSAWSRASFAQEVLCYDITSGACQKVGETQIFEGEVTCVKCFENDNFMVATKKGYLIKFTKLENNSSYQRQVMTESACPGNDTSLWGLSADPSNKTVWLCVSYNTCFKIQETKNDWKVIYRKNQESEDKKLIHDVAVTNQTLHLLYTDKVRFFNFVDDKIQMPSRIVLVGGDQFQVENDNLVVISAEKDEVVVVQMMTGSILMKWNLPGDASSTQGVAVDTENKLIYVLIESRGDLSCHIVVIKC